MVQCRMCYGAVFPPEGHYNSFRQDDGTIMHVYWHIKCWLRCLPRPLGRDSRSILHEYFGDGGPSNAENQRFEAE